MKRFVLFIFLLIASYSYAQKCWGWKGEFELYLENQRDHRVNVIHTNCLSNSYIFVSGLKLRRLDTGAFTTVPYRKIASIKILNNREFKRDDIFHNAREKAYSTRAIVGIKSDNGVYEIDAEIRADIWWEYIDEFGNRAYFNICRMNTGRYSGKDSPLLKKLVVYGESTIAK